MLVMRRQKRSSFSTALSVARAATCPAMLSRTSFWPQPEATLRTCCLNLSPRRGTGRNCDRQARERGEREERDLRETLERQRERVREELSNMRASSSR